MLFFHTPISVCSVLPNEYMYCKLYTSPTRNVIFIILYRNEEECGKATKDSGLKREEIFIVTKVWKTHHGKDKCKEALDESLKR